MKIFEIRDGETKYVTGYLFYYERSSRFYVELPSSLNEWEVPAMFYSNVKRGQYSIGPDRSMKWVMQRIIPAERQNIASILKENHLTEYDEYKLLQLSEGRCAQDDDYITEIGIDRLPEEIIKRLSKKIQDVIPLSVYNALIFFCDGKTTKTNLKSLVSDNRLFSAVMSDEERFMRIKLSPGGNGLEWDEARIIPAELLYDSGEEIDIRYDDILNFTKVRLLDTTQLSKRLDVSRQYIN
ncbi:MAG: DUF2442 domain-containing protein, partial [Lachnospiraceae bacterium]|nr:DUF2442 domain-containing protein [Lachnospiraceae bacterium]